MPDGSAPSPRTRPALSARETQTLIQSVTSSRVAERNVLTISKGEALHIVNQAQAWLDAWNQRSSLEIPLHWRSAIYVLYSLINAHATWPRSMLIDGCTFDRKVNLNAGGSSTIYSGRWKDADVVVKQVHLSSDSKKLFVREAVTWKQLKHEHILPLCGLFPDPMSPADYLMVSPRMSQTLAEYVTPEKAKLSARVTPGGYCPADDCARLISELAQAIAYLHARKIVHGDLKDSNILIDDKKHIRVTDFGLSLVGDATRGAFSTTGSGKGSEGWKAPELYHDTESRRTMPLDVFAFACMCYMLFTGYPPYMDKSMETYYADIVKSKGRRGRPLPHNCVGNFAVSSDLWDLVYGCWRDRPRLRLTMRHVLAWLNVDADPIYQPQNPPYFTTKVLRDYAGNADDELPVTRGETFEVMNCASSRWQVRHKDGRFSYIALDTNEIERCTLVSIQAKTGYTADASVKPKELSYAVGEWLSVVAFRPKWWMVRNASGDAGVVRAKNFARPTSWTRDPVKYMSKAIAEYNPPANGRCHLAFIKGQRIKILRRPSGSSYFIAEIEGSKPKGESKPVWVTGIVPAHMILPVDEGDQPTETS